MDISIVEERTTSSKPLNMKIYVYPDLHVGFGLLFSRKNKSLSYNAFLAFAVPYEVVKTINVSKETITTLVPSPHTKLSPPEHIYWYFYVAMIVKSYIRHRKESYVLEKYDDRIAFMVFRGRSELILFKQEYAKRKSTTATPSITKVGYSEVTKKSIEAYEKKENEMFEKGTTRFINLKKEKNV